jgi:hypothetical protein
MRLKSFIIFFFLMFIVSCTCLKVKVKDEEFLETRLRRRIKAFSSYFLENELEKMWDMRSSWFKKNFRKEDYIGYLKGYSYKRSYYRLEDKAHWVEIKDNKAKAMVSHIEQYKKDSKAKKSFSYVFWVFENDDWFFIEESMVLNKADWK